MVMPVLASKSAMVALNFWASWSTNGPVAVTVLPLNSPAMARSSKDWPEVAVVAAAVAAVVAAAVGAVVAAGAVVGAVVAAGALVSVAAGAAVAGAVVGCGTAVGAGVAAGEHAPNTMATSTIRLNKVLFDFI